MTDPAVDTRPAPDEAALTTTDPADRAVLRPAAPAALLPGAAAAVRRELGPVAAFSLFINLLALVSSLYTLQLFDRVLASISRQEV
jgi:ABC-type protease/lipase transport system fused ATPase/permease subunit